MADDIVQIIENARVDATSLSEFIYYPANVMVQRRLAPSIHTLNYYLDYLHGLELIYSQETGTVIVNGEEIKTVRQAVNDSIDSAIIGEYQTQLEARVATNETDIDQETQRAITREGNIEDLVEAEELRATQAEESISQDLNDLSQNLSAQSFDTGITATAKFGGVERELSEKLTDYNTPKDFGASGNTEADLLGLSGIGLDEGGIIHTDNRSFTIAASNATDYDAITVGGAKLYINKEPTSFETRAEFVAAVENGLKIKKDTVIQAGNVSYIYDKTSSEILDLPNFKPFGTVEFEHFGGFPKRDDPTRAVIKHYRQDANTILDVVRIVNPKPDTFTLKTHPDIAPNGDSPRISLRTFAALNNVAAMVNGNAFKNIDGSAGAGNAIIKPDGLFIADGVAYTGWADAGNIYKTHALLCKRDGIFHPTYRFNGGDAASYVAEGAVWGFSWGAWLVLNGVAQTIPTEIASNTKSARTIIGQAANGDYIIICAEGSTGSYGLTPNECGVVAAQHGCERAFMCDGGGSAQLWWETFYALPSSDNSFSDERTLGTGLAINCPLSEYDTGWINQPLASGFTAKDSIGVRVRQTNSKTNFEFFVEGTFTTTGTQVLSGTRPLRYMPANGIGTARGALVGAGGSLGTWYTGNSISIRKSVDTDVTNYFGGHTSWTAKHALSNTAP